MSVTAMSIGAPRRRGWRERLRRLDWILIGTATLLTAIGAATLYSAAGGSFEPWAGRHILRFALFPPLLGAALFIDVRTLKKGAWALYGVCVLMLVAVDVIGVTGKGAERWIAIGGFRFQPSEPAKLAVVLVIAHLTAVAGPSRAGHPLTLIGVAALLALPILLVARQPDLGTAVLIAVGAGGVYFVSGVGWRWLSCAALAAAVVTPFAVTRILKPYQLERVMTFLSPEKDPLGAGYHILQSKIAFGSGGLHGRGFLEGTQGQLAYLPEMTTDFAFALFAEEFGFIGAMAVLALFVLLAARGFAIALAARSPFARLAGVGCALTLSLYVIVNMAMVTGLIPVVGVPLPFLSYGGSAMLTALLAIAILQIIHIHADEDPDARRGFAR